MDLQDFFTSNIVMSNFVISVRDLLNNQLVFIYLLNNT